MENKKFEDVLSINVNDKTEKKEGLTYLTWSWAWAEFKKIYPNATYSVKKNENGLPYFNDDNYGIIVFTEVTVDNLTHEMWLPVMNSSNKSMKSRGYTYETKNGEKKVEQATMFDINKTLMRCLVKNLAMFGLGLYIYSGEDLPEESNEQKEEKKSELEELKAKIDKIDTIEGLKGFYMMNQGKGPEFADYIAKRRTELKTKQVNS
jgi:hypothetical protein